MGNNFFLSVESNYKDVQFSNLLIFLNTHIHINYYEDRYTLYFKRVLHHWGFFLVLSVNSLLTNSFFLETNFSVVLFANLPIYYVFICPNSAQQTACDTRSISKRSLDIARGKKYGTLGENRTHYRIPFAHH